MRVSAAVFAAACTLFRTGIAVLADEAWNVDYHLALLGAPQQHTTFFHQPFLGSKASLLYTLSEKAVLGAVNPKDGSVVWRQPLTSRTNNSASFLRTSDGQDVVISAIDGEVAAWSSSDGRQSWSHDLQAGVVRDLEIVEIQDVNQKPGIKDALVLSTDAHSSLTRLDGLNGHVKWTFKDESGDEAYQVSASATEIFCIFLHPTLLGGTKIKVVSLDPTNGRKIDQYTLSSENDIVSSADIISVGANTASPIIAWSNKARTSLKVNVIGSKSVSTFPIDTPKTIQRLTLHAPYHANARPHFLVHYQTAQDHWAEVYHVDLKHLTVSKAYSLPKIAGEGAFSTSTSDANVYFTRISESEVSVVSSATHGILARWPLEPSCHVNCLSERRPVHAVADISVKSDSVSAIRVAVYLNSGDWILLRDGIISWERPEALSYTFSAVWAYPPAKGDLVHDLEVEGHSDPLQAFTHRIRRHVNDLIALPGYVATLPERFIRSIGPGSGTSEQTVGLQNHFGFHKTVVCATTNGRLIALDAGDSGRIMWNNHLPDFELGKLPQLLPLSDGTILVKSSEGNVLLRLDAATGVAFTSLQALPDSLLPELSPYSYTFEGNRFVEGSIAGKPAWQFAPTGEQKVVKITPRPVDDPVASIGKVLGDRRVLYKYLNPNIVMVTSVSQESNIVTISLVDAVSGTVVYTAVHNDVDVTLPLASAISENWFAYSFTSVKATSGSKGHQLVVGEMYESPMPNDRGPRGAAFNASAITFSYEPYVVAQTYHLSEAISYMAVTQTRQGITSRLLLAVLRDSHAVVGIPRSIVDPRRPVGRDPSPTEAAEGLVRYDPVLRFDPKWYLTHQREVIGVEHITTSPALLESTSLIFVYGLDLFGTRASPSFSFDILGKDFNKLQMLATVAALAIATLLVAPLVKRKQINARWQFAQ